MLEEIVLDKARIARLAGEEWKEASPRWGRLVADEDFLWEDPADRAVSWLEDRVDAVLQMTEADLRRAVKQYLSSWAQAELKRLAKERAEEVALEAASGWSMDDMLADFQAADRITRGKVNAAAGVENVPTRVPETRLAYGRDGVEASEFWGEYWLEESAHGVDPSFRSRDERLQAYSRAALANKMYAEGPPMKKDRHGRYHATIPLDRFTTDWLDGRLKETESGIPSIASNGL
jgi:hypothetical protein